MVVGGVLPDDDDEAEEEEVEEEVPKLSPSPSPGPVVSMLVCRNDWVSATPCTHRMADRIKAGTLRHAKTRPGGNPAPAAPALALVPVFPTVEPPRGLGGKDKEAGEKG